MHIAMKASYHVQHKVTDLSKECPTSIIRVYQSKKSVSRWRWGS